jgi:predicted permease
MSLQSRFRSFWTSLARRSDFEQQMETELRTHIEEYAEDLMRNGLEREEALRRARAEFGSVAASREQCRESLGLKAWDDLAADVRYGFRQLRNSPAFTATVLIVLALGIGANAAIFSILDATLLRRLPFSRPNDLLSLRVLDEKETSFGTFYPDILEWQHQAHTLQSIAFYNPDNEVDLQSGNLRQAVSAPHISSNLFQVLGISPELGRGFLEEEQVPGKGNEVILSDSAWRLLFHADPSMLGKTVSLDDAIYTVVGVMPRGFAFPVDTKELQVWIPAIIGPKDLGRNLSFTTFSVIGRMRHGATPESVRTELTGIQKRLLPLYTGMMAGPLAPSHVAVTRYRDTLVQQARPALLALLAAVVLIWLIACANVGNLMLARGTARERELAVRGALGAGRWRLVRQLITESLLLSLLGGAAGLVLAQVAMRLFDKVLRSKLNLSGPLAPNAPVLLALLALSVLSAMVFGFVPAWLAAKSSMEESLRQGSSQTGGIKHHRLQRTLVVTEIGLSLVLLVGCGLLLRTLFQLRRVPLGFRTDRVLITELKLPHSKQGSVDLNQAVYRPLLERVQNMPGVIAASLTTVMPLRNSFDSTLELLVKHSSSQESGQERIDAKLRAASSELQRVLGFRMYQGRFFNDQDTPDSQPVAVVNRAFARLYAPDGDIVDQFKFNLDRNHPGRTVKVVGVMEDFHQAAISQPAAPEIIFCAPQLKPTDGFYQPVLQAHVELAVRTTGDPETFIPDLRRVMAEVNPDLQASSFETMNQVVEDSLGSQLLAAHLLELFAGCALVIALTGLYGLLTYLVTQRTHELGIRIALGAQRPAILGMMLRQAGWLLLSGAVLGLVLSFSSTHLLSGFLYGVKANDGWTIVSVGILLLASGLLAAYLPARRAAGIDPMEALRDE